MKYIDTEKLIAEIERQQRRLILLSNTEQVDMRRDCALQNGVYDSILTFITSLQQEQPEVYLEKEVKSYIKDNFTITDEVAQIPEEDRRYSMWEDDMVAFAKHFFELGRINARKEE